LADHDPRSAGASRSPWDSPETVAGFVRSAPNAVLIAYAERLRPSGGGIVLDVGCGAGRNAIPLAVAGWTVIGTDTSRPMLTAAQQRWREEGCRGRAVFVEAPMEVLPVRGGGCDLVVAHGVWNLATSTAMFRSAVDEAARAARPGGALFVFTFSRNTLPASATPIAGERFVFTEFSGRPQVFLTEEQLAAEMDRGGFDADPTIPVTEYNRPSAAMLRAGGPVIYEAAFRRRG
jgi:SAM-dependent methyltransferase